MMFGIFFLAVISHTACAISLDSALRSFVMVTIFMVLGSFMVVLGSSFMVLGSFFMVADVFLVFCFRYFWFGSVSGIRHLFYFFIATELLRRKDGDYQRKYVIELFVLVT
jgi:hypothetical protein